MPFSLTGAARAPPAAVRPHTTLLNFIVTVVEGINSRRQLLIESLSESADCLDHQTEEGIYIRDTHLR